MTVEVDLSVCPWYIQLPGWSPDWMSSVSVTRKRTLYPVTALPLIVGASHDTPRLRSKALTFGAAGASGGFGFEAPPVAGVPLETGDHSLSSTLFAARTCTWYAVPLVKPVRVVVVAVSVPVSPLRSVQLVSQVGLVAQVLSVAVQARYCTS